ncbi:hypothetical protein PIB30_018710 [Stylosanthes scabra]|uniref:Uncharacterized protein n=1 Tax=Stylosanthes scabra TaxID=79078 RepID=A0ABU6X9N9_9FABA|nr:hypothetical protein [Stylosanthes scabra]
MAIMAEDVTEATEGWFSAGRDGVPLSLAKVAENSVSGSAGNDDVARVIDRDLLKRRLRRFVSLTPPPLLAAVLPWTRDGERGEWSRGCGQWGESMVGRRSGVRVLCIGCRDGVLEVPFFILDESWRVAGTRTVEAAIGDATVTMKSLSLSYFGILLMELSSSSSCSP